MPDRKLLVQGAAFMALGASVLALGRALFRKRPAPPRRGDFRPIANSAVPRPVGMPAQKPVGPPNFGWLLGAALLLALAAGGWWFGHRPLEPTADAAALSGGDARRAPALLIRYGCANCHHIGRVPAPGGSVGPSLDGIRGHVYVGGVLLNTPQNLVRWIVDPRAVNPKTAMPVTGITPEEARDVAAFLYGR